MKSSECILASEKCQVKVFSLIKQLRRIANEMGKPLEKITE